MQEFSPDRSASDVSARPHPRQTRYLHRNAVDSGRHGNGARGSGDVENVALDEADAYLSKLGETRDLRVLLNLSYSLRMLRRLPWYACDDLMPELPPVVRQSSRDAFFVHTRLVAEFFWRPASTDDDARIFLPSWTPPNDVAERLEARWTQAMTFVAPFARDRGSTVLVAPTEVDLSALALEQVVFDCDAAVEAFVDACAEAQVELLPEIRTLLDSAE
jgi:hypothetical protein